MSVRKGDELIKKVLRKLDRQELEDYCLTIANILYKRGMTNGKKIALVSIVAAHEVFSIPYHILCLAKMCKADRRKLSSLLKSISVDLSSYEAVNRYVRFFCRKIFVNQTNLKRLSKEIIRAGCVDPAVAVAIAAYELSEDITVAELLGVSEHDFISMYKRWRGVLRNKRKI